MTTELSEGAADRATASEAADATDLRSDTAGTQAAGLSQQVLPQMQSQSTAQRSLSLHQKASGNIAAMKAEPASQSLSDNSKGHLQIASGHPPTAPGPRQPAKFPLGSPAKIVPLSLVQPLGLSQNPPAQGALAPRAITVGPHTFPVGSTTGIVGRNWPGQPPYNQPVGSSGKPVSAGQGLNESRGTKRASGAESKGRKRQKGDREKSADGEGGMPFSTKAILGA